jgi:uncharacterized protein
MNDLLQKLKESGLIIDKEQIKNTKSKTRKKRLDDIFQGRWDYSQSGEIFIINEVIPYGEKHGSISLTKHINTASYLQFEKNLTDTDIKLENIVFFDIETSSLSFGAGSFVFLIGICYFSELGLESSLLIIDHPSAEKALLERFNKDIENFRIICSYNGKAFDAPFIRNRYALYQVDNILEKKYHIDLLIYARRLWKLRIDSCKLSHVEENILHLKRNDEEIPGWMVPQVYFDFLNKQDPHLLRGIISHNKIDVISLAALYQHIARLFTKSDECGYLDAKDYFSLAKMHETNGGYDEAKYYYHLGLDENSEKDLASYFYWRYGMLLKRLGELTDAIEYFKKSAAKGGVNACIEISKYYEHQRKDYNQALRWAEEVKCIINLQNDSMNKMKLISQLDHRVDRINRKKSGHEK